MAEDAVKIAPHAYKVVLENDKVRVLESRMKPGDKTEMHGHPALIALAMGVGKFKFTTSDGNSMEVEVPPGVPMYFDAAEHTTENIGTTDPSVFLIELKS